MERQYRVGLIRVVTLADEKLRRLHGDILEEQFPMLRVESHCIPDQPEGVHDDATEAQAVPKIITLAQALYHDGAEAIVVSCAGDPGVAELRRRLPIPVVGAGEATAAAALRYGSKFAVLGITDSVPAAYARILGERIVDATLPDNVRTTLDLMTDWGRESVVARAEAQKALGAEVIALACTGMSTIGIAEELERAVGIPVLDPVLCEGAFLLLDLLRAGRLA